MVSDIQAGGGKIANFFYSVAVYADKREGRRANFKLGTSYLYVSVPWRRATAGKAYFFYQCDQKKHRQLHDAVILNERPCDSLFGEL
jgi:hypothetical protein